MFLVPKKRKHLGEREQKSIFAKDEANTVSVEDLRSNRLVSPEQNGSRNCVKASFQISITVGSSLRRENHRGIMYLLSSITGSTGSPSRRNRLLPARSPFLAPLSLSLNSREQSFSALDSPVAPYLCSY